MIFFRSKKTIFVWFIRSDLLGQSWECPQHCQKMGWFKEEALWWSVGWTETEANWNSKQPFLSGCFNWMIPRDYMKNRCFTQCRFKLLVWGSSWSVFLGTNRGVDEKLDHVVARVMLSEHFFSPSKPIQSQWLENSFSLRWHVFKCYVSVRSVPFFLKGHPIVLVV